MGLAGLGGAGEPEAEQDGHAWWDYLHDNRGRSCILLFQLSEA